MYLKRLELQGFKSFPDKIKLEFNKGITAVVGPNGSGKSNIGDAVRWVLGEKSAKSLRGAKMEDVIFNGTANRKPLGFAEVSMVMDNEDRKLNIDYAEVTVTRRMYRSGESDYLINGTKCRAKDIVELFMDTGVGKEGYSIIGQGRIDEILSSKSEDRRLLFEEAAGIVKYRTRSGEATAKLEKERENLVRVNDIISELEKQIVPLGEQAEKARKCLALTERLKLVEVNKFVNDVESYEVAAKKISNNITQLNFDLDSQKKSEEVAVSKKEKLRQDVEKIEQDIEKCNNEIADKRSQAEQCESKIKLIEQDITHYRDNQERIKNSSQEAENSITRLNNDISTTEAKIRSKELELSAKKKLFDEKNIEFNKLTTQVSENEESLNKYNADIIAKMNKATDIKGQLSKNTTMLEQLKSRKKTIENELGALEGQLAERITARDVVIQYLTKKNDEIDLINDRVQKLTENSKIYNNKLNDSNAELQLIEREYNSNLSRLKLLKELEKSYEGYYAGVKAVLARRDNDSAFSGICGAVGELISAEQKYETAIEIALGGAIQNIVVNTENDAKYAINFLKKNGKGRATFLPMSAIKAKSLGNDRINLMSMHGVLGSAKELVKYDSKYESIMSSLLERVLIVDNIDNAIKISRDTKYSYKIVTLDGDLFNIGGSMTGGSVGKKSAGIFSRGREIGDLNDNLNHLSESREKLNTGINTYKEKLSEFVSELDELKSDVQELNIARAEAQSKIEQADEYVNDINSRINNIRIEDKQLESLIRDGAEKVEKQESELNVINEEINSVNARLEEFQHKIQVDRNFKEESFEEISAMRVELNQIENDIYSLSVENKRLKSDIKQINADISNYKKQLVSIDASIAGKEEEILKIKAESDELKETHSDLLNELSEMGNYKGIINNNILELEKNISSLSDTRISIEKELSRLEMQKEQSDLKSRELYDKMWEKYEITYVIAKGYEKLTVSDAELQREEKQLKNEIRTLGSINMNAVEEYNSVKERFDFLTQNRNDIIETEKKLVKVIEQLNELMETQFSEQFAVISKNFTETFKEMFGGGSASLKLNDSEDILNSGIDIIVQPPGKALQNMMLLSGGEKALTAIALLFAILKMKPSPFCILDEIEAALDDANVNRYAEYLDHFTDDTQFVVITHRKGTMEAADILYGVTMQEQGVSKLVSVDFKNKSEFEYKEESL